MSQFDTSFKMLGRALDVATLRHEVIANNIANANTPGYKRKVVDFGGELARALRQDGPIELKVVTSDDPVDPNGNSVRFETEIAALQKNALFHGMLTEFASMRVKSLRAAISGNM